MPLTHRASRSLAVAGITATLVLTSCASQRDTNGGADDAGGGVDSTFIFGASSDPAGLDPSLVSDGESFRVSRNIFEGLVGLVPGTADPEPLLAESWDQTDDGLSYTFQLKEDVTFHDGTDFNAEAVCYNFDRQYNFTGVAQSASVAYYWGTLLGGFADTGTSIYDGCVVNGDSEVTISLNQPFAGFISSLTLPAFAIQSPTALEEHGGNEVGGSSDAPVLSDYATGHPTGTGPFQFDSWNQGAEVKLRAFDDYWGEQGQVREVIFRTIGDTTARRQALESGSIDGFDLVAPADLGALEDAGFTLVNREPFNILYLAFNQKVEALNDARVREALARAIDKEQLITQVLPEGTDVATQFMPEAVTGWNPSVTTYEFDQDRARELLAEAGFTEQNPLSLQFNYPLNVSRPYMPNPEQIYTNLSAQLGAVGVKIEPSSEEWTEYLDRMQGGSDHGIHLLGWTGDYNDPDNFVGSFFGQATNEWGFDNPELFSALATARGETSPEAQQQTYRAINEQIAQLIPGVPLASPVPTLAFNSRVTSYPASPVNDEVFNLIELSE